MPKKYHTALIVGRFQPFHKGHLHLFQEALSMADTITVALGSAYSEDLESNPLSFAVRKEMLEKVIEAEGWQDRVNKIVPSPDFPDDKRWVDTLIHNAGDFDIAIGNNEWTNGVISAEGYEVSEILLANRAELQGVYIRELIRNGGAWKERVPNYLIDFIEQHF